MEHPMAQDMEQADERNTEQTRRQKPGRKRPRPGDVSTHEARQAGEHKMEYPTEQDMEQADERNTEHTRERNTAGRGTRHGASSGIRHGAHSGKKHGTSSGTKYGTGRGTRYGMEKMEQETDITEKDEKIRRLSDLLKRDVCRQVHVESVSETN